MREEFKREKIEVVSIQEYLNRRKEKRKIEDREVKVLTIFEHNVMIQK